MSHTLLSIIYHDTVVYLSVIFLYYGFWLKVLFWGLCFLKTMFVGSSSVSGRCVVPASKSQTMRAILFAALATGKSRIMNYLVSPDSQAMVMACQQFGAKIEQFKTELRVQGVAGAPVISGDTIDAGNSGQVLRFIACLAGLCEQPIEITGDASIQTNRPVQPLIEALPRLGVKCVSLRGNGRAPIRVQGPFSAHETELSGADSQPVSGLLMALAFYPGEHTINVRDAGELPWIDLTLSWLDRFSIPYTRKRGEQYQITGAASISGFTYAVPGDLSSMSFPLVAAVLTQSSLVLENIDMTEPQGDKVLVDILCRMGADITVDSATRSIRVKPSAGLRGCCIDINDCIDCIAILAVVGCFAQGETLITGGEIARQKECDRISVMAAELSKMGANIQTRADGLRIQQSTLRGALVHSHSDHRVAMALAVAGLAATSGTEITDVACIDKSFPGFVDLMQSIGADITLGNLVL